MVGDLIIVYRFDCGICQPTDRIEEENRQDIISSMCLHYVILLAKAELDQLVDGLKSLDVLDILQKNPTTARQLLIHMPKPIDADQMYNLFVPNISPEKSNLREEEEAQLFNWANFLHYVEGMYAWL